LNRLPTGQRALLLATLATIEAAAEISAFAQAGSAAGNGNLQEIVVTGSRIPRGDFSSQAPLVTVDQEAFASRSNIGIEATFSQLPQFNVTGTGSQAQTSAASTSSPQATAAPGAATVNLRGLGLNRTLVLLDGRRVQPINGALVVDLNSIPSALIDRVEVVTGGAAAVYGADAIAGVVNIISRKNFEGIQIDARVGASGRGDGNESVASGLLGFADARGSAIIGVDFAKRDFVLGQDRDWVVRGWNDPGTMAAAVPGGSNLSELARAPPGGYPSVFPLPAGGAYVVDQNGHVFNPQAPLDALHPYTGPLGGGSGFKINPDGSLGFNDERHTQLQVPLERYSLFGSGHLAVADDVEVFSQVRFAENYTIAKGTSSGLFGAWSPTIPYNHLSDDPSSPQFGVLQPGQTALHPVPAELARLLNARGTTSATQDAPWVYAGGLDYLNNVETDTTSAVYQIVGGLRGDFTVRDHGWSWTAYVSHGKSNVGVYQPEGFQYLPRLQDLFAANHYGVNFDVSQLPGYPGAGASGHCTSGLPIFNADGSVNNTPSVSQDCADYVVLRMNTVTTLEQNIFEGTLTGTVANLHSGALRFAVGAASRHEELTFQPDSNYNANQAFPNVVGAVVLPVTVNGKTDAKEAFGELSIPLLNQRLEIDPGIRYSAYGAGENVPTYKLVGQLTASDWIKLRGGYQRANRAPNIAELFTPRGGNALVAGTDACGNWLVKGASVTQPWGNRADNPNRLNVQALCQFLMTRDGAPASLYVPGTPSADDYAYNVLGQQQYRPSSIAAQEGNPKLESESADTYTAGVVLTPIAAARLSITLDWYKIEVDHAIGAPTHDAVYQQCLDAKYNPLIGSSPGTHGGAALAAGNPYCARIRREYVGGVPLTPGNFGADREYGAQFVNEGGIATSGYDIQADWRIGNFDVNVQTSVLDRYAESPFSGAPFVDYTGTVQNSSFDYRFFSTARWGKGPLSVGVRWQHLPSLRPAPSSPADALPVESHDQFDVFGNWSFRSRWVLRAGIDNVLNADPEWVGRTSSDNAIGRTDSNYDQVGRRFFLGLQLNL
jgi:iron complex outermembrane recepter protein